MINRWCVACGSVNLLRRVISREINGGKDELSLLECIECGHAQVEHIGEGDINESVQIDIFNDINTLRREARTKWYKRSAIVARIIDRLVPRGGIAVEVGCGRGEFLQAMGRRWEITGIDISQVAVDMARRATRRNVLKVTYKKYDIPDNSHDLIASFAVIEHLESPRELIQWSSNKLKKGGMLVIMTGDRHSGYSKGNECRMATVLVRRTQSFFYREITKYDD